MMNHSFQLSSTPLMKEKLNENLRGSKVGAVVNFEGIVRDHNEGKNVTVLEYEAYDSLCQIEAQKILTEVQNKFDVLFVHCVHRVGKLTVGDIAIWIGAASSHRDEAFQACRYVIDEIKKRLPIWKKEFYTDGDSGWVNCTHSGGGCKASYEPSEYYSRQTILPQIGSSGQKKLNQAKFLVIGAGGLGSSALLGLAGSGIGTVGICEFDTVAVSNLHRQHLYSYKDIGEKKITAAARRLHELNPKIKIMTHPLQLTAENARSIISDYDCILDCSDNFDTKFLINDAAFFLNKPLIQASIYQFEGQLRVYIPEKSACLRCLWPQTPQKECVGSCAEAGVLGPLPGFFGYLQALEAIKVLLSFDSIPFAYTTYYDLITHESRRIATPRSANCPLCGMNPTIKDLNSHNNSAAANKKYTINIDQLNKYNYRDWTFVDIRETAEQISQPIVGLKTIQLPSSRYNHEGFSFSVNQKYLLFCNIGIRSFKLTDELHKKGITNIYSLEHGFQPLQKFATSLAETTERIPFS
jgi:adenylyltransferase/sulfurtransferase